MVYRDLMSVTESGSENEGPIASRTRSRNIGSPTQSGGWCNRTRTTRDINASSSEGSSLSLSDSYLETEFPAYPGSPSMDNQDALPLPRDLLELLHEMTERLHAHEQRIGGGGGDLQEQVASSLQYFVVLLLMILTNGFKNFNVMPFLMGGPLNKS